MSAALDNSAAQGTHYLDRLQDLPQYVHRAPEPSDRFPANWYPADQMSEKDVLPGPITGLPYTGISVETSKSSAGDEATESVNRNPQARDSMGRTRTEALGGGGRFEDNSFAELNFVQVFDPVSHCSFTWSEFRPDLSDHNDHVAFVTCASQTLKYYRGLTIVELVLKSLDEDTEDRSPTTLVEQLSPLSIDGLTLVRHRVTNTDTSQPGQPKTSFTDNWYSPDLRILIRLGDDRSNVMLTDIRRVEPDPKLFYPPVDYRIEVQHPVPR